MAVFLFLSGSLRSSSITSTTASLTTGALIGALPNQSPVVFKSTPYPGFPLAPPIVVTSQRRDASTIVSSPLAVPDSEAQVSLPSSLGASVALPAAIDSSLVQYASNLYAYAESAAEPGNTASPVCETLFFFFGQRPFFSSSSPPPCFFHEHIELSVF